MSTDPTAYVSPPLINPYESGVYSHVPPAPPRRRHLFLVLLALLLILCAVAMGSYMLGEQSVALPMPVNSSATATVAYAQGYSDGQSSGYSTGFDAGQTNVSAIATAAYQQGQADDSSALQAWIKANCHPDAQGHYTIWYDSKDQLWCY